MTRTTLSVAILCALAGCRSAGEPDRARKLAEEIPFGELVDRVHARHGNWMQNSAELRRLFGEERKRLGGRFEEEMIRLAGEDFDRNYFCATALKLGDYPGGARPMPEMALLMYQQALALCETEVDKDIRPSVIATSALAAIVSRKLELTALASSHKRRAESLIDEFDVPRWRLFPVVSRENYKIYESIR